MKTFITKSFLKAMYQSSSITSFINAYIEDQEINHPINTATVSSRRSASFDNDDNSHHNWRSTNTSNTTQYQGFSRHYIAERRHMEPFVFQTVIPVFFTRKELFLRLNSFTFLRVPLLVFAKGISRLTHGIFEYEGPPSRVLHLFP